MNSIKTKQTPTSLRKKKPTSQNRFNSPSLVFALTLITQGRGSSLFTRNFVHLSISLSLHFGSIGNLYFSLHCLRKYSVSRQSLNPSALSFFPFSFRFRCRFDSIALSWFPGPSREPLVQNALYRQENSKSICLMIIRFQFESRMRVL